MASDRRRELLNRSTEKEGELFCLHLSLRANDYFIGASWQVHWYTEDALR